MNIRKPNLIGRVAGGLLAAAIALPVQAGVSSSAVIDITNFTITGSGFSFSTGQPGSTGDVSSALSGFPGSNLAGNTTTNLLDLVTVCTGSCPQIGSNLFPVISGAPSANFATSDQFRTGSLTTGARIASGAYTAIAAGNNTASADSNNNLNGTFTVGTAGPLTFAFDVDAYLESFVHASEGFPGFSTGAYSVTLSILNLSGGGQTVFSWSPNGAAGGINGGVENADPYTLNSTVSLNAPLPVDTLTSNPHQAGVATSGHFEAVTNALQPGQLYQLSMRVTANADASRVQAFSALGDRVWKDTNSNGIQDCVDTNGNGILGDAGDTGAECGNGVSGVRVTLTDCQGNAIPGQPDKFTDANGFYLFTGLDPANEYRLTFDSTTTGGLSFTTKGPDGTSDPADSDADTTTGETECISLTPNATDRTWDAGLVEPFIPAKLGDRVWEDKNGNGLQDCADTNNNGILGDAGDVGAECGNGVPNVTVKLTDCAGNTLDTDTTNASGFYLFENLNAGSYCVEFVKPTNFCAGVEFTSPNAGNDTADSDANPANGTTGSVTLAAGETNLTVDAGIYCPAKLGDRIWLDNNTDGNQNCSGVDPANPGQVIPNGGATCTEPSYLNPVTVRLTDCAGNTATDIDGALVSSINTSSGFYLFTNLKPGAQYCVEFTKPASYNCTTANAAGVGYQVNSDGVVNGGLCTTGGVTLASGGDDRSLDLGLVLPPANCDLRVNKTCEVVTPPSTTPWVCKTPLDELTMISAFTSPVKIKAWKGSVGSTLLATIDNIQPGQEVSVGGYAGSGNDVIWEVFNAGTSTKIGESSFHLSCSDSEMNGPEDCGKLEGDNKKNLSSYLNKWKLEGMYGTAAGRLDCTVTPAFPTAESCTATLTNPPSCLTMGKPTKLEFEYTGLGCSASNNPQGGNATCTSTGTLTDPAAVRAAGHSSFTRDVYTVAGSPVSVGSKFTITFGGAALKGQSYVELKGANGKIELNSIHTSCSQVLAVGDQFGSLKLVGFNGATGGTDVNYGYTVSNFGDPVTVTSMVDNKLGPVGSTPFNLATGAIAKFTEVGTITGTTTNTVNVEANTATGAICKAADSLTVTVAPPPPKPVPCSDLKPIDGIKLEFDSALTGGKTISGVKWYKTTVTDLNNPVASNLVGSTGAIADGGVFNFTGFAAASATNDVDFIVTLSDNSKIRSRFHRSCSDIDMNDVTDCGKLQGDGKDNTAGPNIWYLRDLSGNGKVLGCPAP